MRKFKLIIALAIILSITSNYSYSQVCSLSQLPSNLQNGLVAYYPFCGNANDVSGNGNTLQSFGLTSTTDRFGTANSAYSFSNTQTNVTSYLKAVSPSAFAKTNYTISAWFNTSQFYPASGGVTYNYQQIVSYSPQWYQWGPAYGMLLTHANNSTVGAEHWEQTSGFLGVGSATGSISTNQWYHAVQTYDGTTLRLYVNGSLVGSIQTPLSYANQVQFLIGCRGDGPSPGGLYGGFNGKLDDIGFWSRSLSSCEVSQLYSQTSTSIPQQSFSANPLTDTTRVCGTTTTLDAGAGYATYLWNTGATTRTITPTTNGTYSVTVTNAAGCTASDNTYLNLINANIIQNNSTVCLGTPVTLNIDTSTIVSNGAPIAGFAGPYSYGGHYYYFSNGSATWANANVTCNSFGGHLATFSNAAENNYVASIANTRSNFVTATAAWFGITDQDVEGTWKEVQGNLLSYTNWAANEPSNSNNEDYGMFYTVPAGGSGLGTWNDLSDNGSTFPYVLEIEATIPWSVLWSNGSTTNTIVVTPTQSTTYSVTISDGVASCIDSVRVTVSNIGVVNPLIDTTRFCGASATLDAGSGYTTYSWNTGATTRTISPTTGGFYKVTVSNIEGCTASDSTFLSMVKANIINNDTTICKGSSITLSIDSLFPGRTVCDANQLPANLRNGLVAYYPFCGNANDASGNGNNGVVNGATLITDRFGQSNNAYSFNGVSSYIRISNSATLNNSSVTVSGWFNASTLASNDSAGAIGLIGKWWQSPTICNGNYNAYLACLTKPVGQNFSFLGAATSFYEGNVFYAPPIIITNRWYHFVFSHSNNYGGKIYLNGSLVNSNSIVGNICNSLNDLVLGADVKNGAIWRNLNGKLDDIAIWNRTLSQSEVTQLFTSAPTPLWSTGATTNSITVSPTQSTTYSVTVSDGVTSCVDSVRVNVSDIGVFNPLSDTTRICGTTTTLDAGSGYTTYLWNTGATTRTITPTSGGFYKVTVANAAGCSASDSTFLSLVKANILNNDTTICKGSSITLSIDSLFPGKTVCSAAELPVNLQTGLIGYWPFCGNANNVASNQNHIAVNAGVLSTDRFNLSNSAYYFNNTFGEATNISISMNGNITVSYWQKLLALTNSKAVLEFSENYACNSNPQVYINNQILYLSKCSLGTNGALTIGNSATVLDKWVNVTWTVGTGTTKLYVNGGLVGTANVAWPATSLVRMTIGNAGNNASPLHQQPTNVVLDDIYLYNRTLTSAEVNQLYTSAPSVLWSTGATTNSITVSPTQSTTYYVTVSDGITSCVDSVRVNISTVDTSLTVLDPPQVCAVGGQVRMQAGVATAYQWQSSPTGTVWSNIVGGTNSLYTATATGYYRVRLVNSLGCTDYSRVVQVVLNPQPVVSFTVNSSDQCINGNNFTFTNTSSIGSGGTMTYYWNFGDAGTATTTNASHTYTTPGTYIVKLIATSNNGCIDSTTRTVTVNPTPTVSFTINNSTQCVNGNSFLFTSTSTISSGTMAYAWSFGDGGTATTAAATYSYTAAGTYTVKLVVTSNNGCKDSTSQTVTVNPKPTVSFTINNNAQCVNGNSFVFTNTSTIGSGTMTYAWDFGDAGTSTATSPTHTYAAAGSYIVKLVATSNNGCMDSTSVTVTVNPKPTANFTINQANQCLLGNSYVFTNTSTIASGTMTHAWDFGDAGTASTLNATHVYTAAGNYNVRLISTSANGCADTITKPVIVYAQPTGTIATPTSTVICQGSSVTLTASGGATYQWYLNAVAIAGATSATLNATQPGVYTVKIISVNGCFAMASNSITLTLVVQPQVDFSYDKYCAGFATTFTNTSVVTNSGTVSYIWNFGDNNSSSQASPSHTYVNAGSYTVNLSVTPTACPALVGSKSASITVVPALPNLRYTSVNAVSGQNQQLNARLLNGATYVWNPPIGLSSVLIKNPVFNHTTSHDYLITINTVEGCVITDSLLVRIFSKAEIYVSDAFTPNGDNKNDKLMPRLVGIEKLNYFRVYDRWGQQVYVTSTEGEGWDGTFKGAKQPIETYTWIAEGKAYDGTIIKRAGSAVLIR